MGVNSDIVGPFGGERNGAHLSKIIDSCKAPPAREGNKDFLATGGFGGTGSGQGPSPDKEEKGDSPLTESQSPVVDGKKLILSVRPPIRISAACCGYGRKGVYSAPEAGG